MNYAIIIISIFFVIALWWVIEKTKEAIAKRHMCPAAVQSLCRQYIEQKYDDDLLRGRACMLLDTTYHLEGIRARVDIRELEDVGLPLNEVFGLGATLIINDGAVSKILDSNIRHYRRNKS